MTIRNSEVRKLNEWGANKYKTKSRICNAHELSFLTSLFHTGKLFFTTKNGKVETEKYKKT